ncbi:MAG: hypothetical protein AAF353_20375 [Pseudomonadota bacterium]
MPAQTIALFRFIMLGILSRKLALLVVVLILVAVISGSFLAELSIINGVSIVAAFVADFLRYSLALLLILVIASSVAEDYEFQQFERLLTMPLARWQYIAAQVLVVAFLSFLLSIAVLFVMTFYSGFSTAVYWAISLWMELFLVGLLGFLAIMSLEKVPLAVFFSIAVYMLAKMSGLITTIVSESVRLSDGSVTSRTVEVIFNGLLYLFPGTDSFAQNDVFFHSIDLFGSLAAQGASVLVYGGFIVAVSLVEFYRKEFNL